MSPPESMLGAEMNSEEMSQLWQQQSQDVAKSIAEWRNAHPKATLAEIETAVDE